MAGTRFHPSRAGIVNLWDYRDEEFVFVNGWLVLRGPNGSGKTKALEVLFPFLLDGRIEPRRLNPFASEERTMKSNLLYRGQDASHAYVWMEFHRPHATGDDEYVTIGIGLRAHRHVDKVTRWHFVVDGRVGVDFSIIDADDRPLNRRDLLGELGADRVYDAIDDYRRAVDQRLFGLGPTRYEQLLDLVLTLRKPQLAKDLNPVELSRTLQSGLRPLDDALVIEAARSFEDMEAVARTLEGLVAADEATASFLSVYSTYLRTHARAAADALTNRRRACERRQSEVDESAADRDAAEAAHHEAAENLTAAEDEPGRLRAHLDALKSSAAYQSRLQLDGVRQHVRDLAASASRAQAATAKVSTAVEARRAELERAQSGADDATASLHRLREELDHEAEIAGIRWTSADSVAPDAPTRLTAHATARRDDLRAVRERLDGLARAEHDHDRATHELSAARLATAAATDEETAAEEAVSGARQGVHQALEAWRVDYADALATVADADLGTALERAVDHAGTPDAPTMRDTLSAGTAAGVTALRDEIAGLGRRGRELIDRRTTTVAERDRIAAERDDAPTPALTRPADRGDRPGAPLWRLVDFAPKVKRADAAAVEAALEAAGLLDAWVHPDPAQTGADYDGYLVPLPEEQRPSGRTLADFLVPEPDTAVPSTLVIELLSSISLAPTLRPDEVGLTAVATAGQYRLGVLLGAFTKATPEYIGATARAARRAARVAECELLIAALTTEIGEVDERRESLQATLTAVDAAVRALPSLAAILAALRELDRAATTLRLRREAESAAVAALDQAIAVRTAAGAALRRVTVERNLPTDRLESVDAAVRRFESVGQRLEPARRAETSARQSVDAARVRLGETEHDLGEALEMARAATRLHQEKLEAYETLAAAVDDADARRIAAEVAETEQAIARAEALLRDLRRTARDAYAALAAAGQRVADARASLRTALEEANIEAVRLRPYAHSDILSLLRAPTDLRWPTVADDGPDAPLAAGIMAVHEAILAATKELTPTENSLKQSATRLTTALTELQAQLPAAGLDHRPEFSTDDGVIVVGIADEAGLTPVAHFAERIAKDRRDQAQLLSEAERRIFEDALLTQLARQIHHRTIESRDLVESMDRQMRARRMSSGLTVGVGWQLSDDLDADQREACKLLERDPARLGPAQLATLRGHFAQRIKMARAMAPEQPYRELLGQALDYRRWRVFAFSLHRPGGTTENLTRARHSQLSGGEQSVSLHLPLFAAANALFTSANPTAPRILGLDEAFAGVDENGRAELMALASQFDLDLFMTGFDLWATHSTVRGAAHYDLSHSAVEHAVATVLLAWNGSVTTADFDGTLARALGSPETRRVAGASLIGTDDDAMLALDLE